MGIVARTERDQVRVCLPSGHSALVTPKQALDAADEMRTAAYNAVGLASPAWEIELRELRLRCAKLDRKLRARSIKLGRARRAQRALYQIAVLANLYGRLKYTLINEVVQEHGNPHLEEKK